MQHLPNRVAELAELMKEFGLSEAELKGEGWRVALRKSSRVVGPVVASEAVLLAEPDHFVEDLPEETPEAAPAGDPIASPMAGIFYNSPSPNAPAFVKEGDTVEEGQVVGLIEAMKVFNEIVAPRAGIILKVSAKSGDLVAPGEALLWLA